MADLGECVLSTCGFGYVHDLAGWSSRKGISELHWQSSYLPGQMAEDTFFQFSPICLFPFPFPPPSHCSFSSEGATSPSSCSVCGQADPHSSPPLFTLSARIVVLAYCQTSHHLLCCHHLWHHRLHHNLPHSVASSAVQSTLFQVLRRMALPGILVWYTSFGLWSTQDFI